MKADKLKVQMAMARECIGTIALAERAGMSTSTVSRVTRGLNTRPEALGKVAKALNVDPAEIVQQDANW